MDLMNSQRPFIFRCIYTAFDGQMKAHGLFFNVLSLCLSLFLMFFWYLSYYFCALIGQSCQQIRVNQKSCHLIMTNDFHAAVHLGVQSPSAYCALFGMVIEFWIIGCQGSIALMCVLQMVDEGKWHLLPFAFTFSSFFCSSWWFEGSHGQQCLIVCLISVL